MGEWYKKMIMMMKHAEINKRIEADPEYREYSANINHQIYALEQKRIKKREEVEARIRKELDRE